MKIALWYCAGTLAGVEAHAERRRMRPQLRDRLGELVAAVAPAELRVGDVAAVAIGEAEIVLARDGPGG